MQKKVIVLLVATLLICGCGKVPVLKNGEEALVSLKEDSSISVEDFYSKLKDKYGVSMLIEMIDETILAKEYPDKDQDKKDYADAYIDNLKGNYETESEYLSALNQSGFANEDEAKAYLSLNYLRNLAVEDYAKSLVKEKAIKNYYEDETVGDIRCSHILITWKETDDISEKDAKAAALKKAKSLIKELDSADDVASKFAELAKKNSEDASAEDGGDLNFFNKGKNVEEFEKAAYALKKGKYTTEPVETEFGYHIILKTDEKAKASYDDAKESIIETLAQEIIENDNEIQYNALIALRDEYDMSIEDDSLVKSYNTYIQQILSYLNSSSN